MKTIEWLNAQDGTPVEVLESLRELKGIKYSCNPDYPKLYVLNYCQINSPKYDAMVRECRSLVVEFDGEWRVVSRSFDRFYNYGEKGGEVDVTECVAYDKLDGSLICVFWYNNEWLYRTRKMIMPKVHINDDILNPTWDVVIEEALGETWMEDAETYKDNLEDPDRYYTFIFEVTSPYNQMVVKYEECKAHLLAIRSNTGGQYVRSQKFFKEAARRWGWVLPNRYTFETYEDCAVGAEELPNLEEGYVLYMYGVPVSKVKNPAYVAAHRLRGECSPTPRMVMDMILINEHDEYLALFPQESPRFEPYLKAWDALWKDVDHHWAIASDIIGQKEFAAYTKQQTCWPILFNMRKGMTPRESLTRMMHPGQRKQIEAYVQ